MNRFDTWFGVNQIHEVDTRLRLLHSSCIRFSNVEEGNRDVAATSRGVHSTRSCSATRDCRHRECCRWCVREWGTRHVGQRNAGRRHAAARTRRPSRHRHKPYRTAERRNRLAECPLRRPIGRERGRHRFARGAPGERVSSRFTDVIVASGDGIFCRRRRTARSCWCQDNGCRSPRDNVASTQLAAGHVNYLSDRLSDVDQ